MISYFIKTGGPNVSEFNRYVHQEMGFKTILDNYANKVDFGPDLKLLLIKYIVDGNILTFKENKNPVSAYSASDKDISVDVHVRPDNFWSKNEIDRRHYIIDTTLYAISLVEKQLAKKQLAIEFDKLKKCVKLAETDYLSLKELVVA